MSDENQYHISHPHNSNLPNMGAQGFPLPFTINDNIFNYNSNLFMYNYQPQQVLQNPTNSFQFQGGHVDQFNKTLSSVLPISEKVPTYLPYNKINDPNHEVIRNLGASEMKSPTLNSVSSSEGGVEDDFSKNNKDGHKGQSGYGDKSEKVCKRKRKGEENKREARIAFMTKSEVDNLEDGYRWRKYGQKPVKNSPFPRSYYRCTTQKCGVKKRIERSSEDSAIVITTYEGQHNHHSPAMFRGNSTALFGGPSPLMPTPTIFTNNFSQDNLFPSSNQESHANNSTLYPHIVDTSQLQPQVDQFLDWFHQQ